MSPPTITTHPDGVFAVDTGYVRPGMAAAHIIQQDGRAAFVDVGTAHAVPHLLAALDQLGVAPEAVDYVFVTHVHLDHAGGVGQLMRALPTAQAVLHPRGAPHLIAPEKLAASTRAVYGEERFRELYGEIVPVAAGRVRITADGEQLSLAGRPFACVHTPGHALHHHCLVDLDHAGIFTGDTFGVSYRELDTERGAFIVATTTPTQFDPEQLLASVDRLLAYAPRAMFLMHYGRVTDPQRLGAELKSDIRRLVEIARRHAGAADAESRIAADIRAAWLARARSHGCTLSDAEIVELLDLDVTLDAQGLVAWTERVLFRIA
jgi:glyoxylase-like metal-dependent hydrolase (beta-lactamase superfamily II)